MKKDTREKTGWFFSPSDVCEGTIEHKLDTGDYTIVGAESQLCIERKSSVTELAKNICEKRYWAEMQRMDNFRWKFVICEFPFKLVTHYPIGANIPPYLVGKIKTSKEFMLRCISVMQVKYGISVIFCDTPEDAKAVAFNIMKRVQENIYGTDRTTINT